MFSLDNIVVTKKLIFIDIEAKFDDIVIWTIVVFVLVLLFKNSIEMWHEFNASYKNLFFALICFIVGTFSLNKVSEFLYFNF